MGEGAIPLERIPDAIREGRLSAGDRVAFRYQSYISDGEKVMEKTGTVTDVELPEDMMGGPTEGDGFKMGIDVDGSDSENDWKVRWYSDVSYGKGLVDVRHRAWNTTTSRTMGKFLDIERLESEDGGSDG